MSFVCEFLGIRSATLETKRQKLAPAATGKKSEVANAHEALWKQMKQKALQEFLCRQWQLFLHVSMRTVSPGEGNFSVLERNQAMIRNGHSMGVAAEIFEHLLRPAEWGLAVNHPIVAIEVMNEGMKRLRIRKMLQFPVKADFPFSKSLLEGVLDLSSKNLPQCTLRQKEPIARIRRHPALVIKR